ncbi:MAG: glycosyltransferase [Leptolyngbyaceae bacterium]|nr:glycosyltransferase [Leptolyngbyaceae bacterium]
MPTIDVLIPTYNRPDALVVTLTSLCAQAYRDFRVIVSDQTEDQDMEEVGTLQNVQRVLHLHAQLFSSPVPITWPGFLAAFYLIALNFSIAAGLVLADVAPPIAVAKMFSYSRG